MLVRAPDTYFLLILSHDHDQPRFDANGTPEDREMAVAVLAMTSIRLSYQYAVCYPCQSIGTLIISLITKSVQ